MDLSDPADKPPSPERVVQQPLGPAPESTRSLTSPPSLRVDERIAELENFSPPSDPALRNATPSDGSSKTDFIVDAPPKSSTDLQFLPPAADVPRSQPPSEVRQLTSSKVPSSKIGRLFHYGGKSLYP